MCFSVQVDKDLKKLSKRFRAKVSPEAYQNFAQMQKLEAELGPEKIKEVLGLRRKPKALQIKESKEDGRIYPGYFAPVIIFEGGERIIKPMRYRVRPAGSGQEIPSKYNVFNARIDSLEKRRTWQSIFMKKHGLFPFHHFYEWVEDDKGSKRLIKFDPGDREIMWAPVIFDTWQAKDGTINFSSFALITDDPPPEIAEQGHDRCPIFLKEELIDKWLRPEGQSKEKIYSILKEIEQVHYLHEFAA